MTNEALGSLLINFAILGLPVMFFAMTKHNDNASSPLFLAYCFFNTLWAVSHAMFYMLPDETAALLMFDLRLVFINASFLTLYLLIYSHFSGKRIDKTVACCLYILPAITLTMILTNRTHHLVNSSIEFVNNGTLRIVDQQTGPWYIIHWIICFTFIVLSLLLVIKKLPGIPVRYRTAPLILFIGLVLSLLASVLVLFKVAPAGIELLPFACIFFQVLDYFAFFFNDSVDAYVSSREIVFEEYDDPLLVLDGNGEIIDHNRLASMLFKSVNSSKHLKGQAFDPLLSCLIQRFSGSFFEDDNSIFTLHEEQYDVHYQIEIHSLHLRGKRSGSYVTIKNISPIITLIHRLEDSAYFDSLTHLRNRNYMNIKIDEFDKQGAENIGVICGDINKLKEVNDTFGHATGDMLLLSIAYILDRCKPPKTTVARIGGDEFLLLCEGATDAALQQCILEIESECKQFVQTEELYAPCSIALAYAIKTDPGQSLYDVIDEADKKMYLNKYNRRGASKPSHAVSAN